MKSLNGIVTYSLVVGLGLLGSNLTAITSISPEFEVQCPRDPQGTLTSSNHPSYTLLLDKDCGELEFYSNRPLILGERYKLSLQGETAVYTKEVN